MADRIIGGCRDPAKAKDAAASLLLGGEMNISILRRQFDAPYFIGRTQRLSLAVVMVLLQSLSFAQSKQLTAGELKRLVQKAENGSLSAQVDLARALEIGRIGTLNYPEAAHWYRRAADQGDPSAQSELGLLYLNGRGVKQSYSEAVRWLQRAAASASPLGEHNLALMYLNGWGVGIDRQYGMDLLLRAARAGLDRSQLDLAIIYQGGQLVPGDAELAYKWLQKATRHKLPAAEFALGFAYERGNGTKQDFSKAAEHYRVASDANYGAAQNNLGLLYLEGRGVKRDPQAAERLLIKAADQGTSQSYFNLALCSLKGCTGVIDITAAYSWYLSGVASGIGIPEQLRNIFTQISGEMPEEQRAHAHSTSTAWIAQHPVLVDPLGAGRSRPTVVTMAADGETKTPTSEVMGRLWQ